MIRTTFARLRATLMPKAREARLQEDFEEHLAALTEAYVSRGMPFEEAWLVAKRDFGSLEATKDRYRDQARYRIIEDVWRDARLAMRQCRKSPGFTAVAVVSLALGIGANTALFSFIDAILFQQLPAPEATRLFILQSSGKSTSLSYGQVNFLNRNAKQFDGIGGRFPMDVSISVATNDLPQWTPAELVTGSYFHALEVKAARGRLLTQRDLDDAAGDPVCVVSHAFWNSALAGDPRVVGRKIRVNMREYRIVGVTEPGFGGSDIQQPAKLQLPATRIMDFMPSFVGMPNFDWHDRLSFFSTITRLRRRATKASAAVEVNELSRAYASLGHLDKPPTLDLVEGKRGFIGNKQFLKPASVLLAVSSVVLVIACANLATLLLSRVTVRAREFAVRLALGCSRGRLIAQILMENVVLGAGGSVAGLAVAFALQGVLLAFLNRAAPAIHHLHVMPDIRILAFAAGVSIFCVLLFGTAPAFQAAGTAALGSSAGNTKRPGARKALVSIQIALSFVVLLAAGLLTRSLSHLQTVDLGYPPDELLVLQIRPAAGGYTGTRAFAFYSRVVERLRALAGIRAACSSFNLGIRGRIPFLLDASPEGKHSVDANIAGVGPRYFETMGAHVIAGRDFNDNDRAGSPSVYLISQHLARAYFPGLNPVGRYLLDKGRRLRVIGVVTDIHDQGIRDGNLDTVYQDSDQYLASSLTVLARCAGPCKALLSSVRTAMEKLDPNTPILDLQIMRTEIGAAFSSQQILGLLSALFAALAILLTGAGLYGVMSDSVAVRRREIGVRMAMGASARNVAAMLAEETGIVVLAGALVGVPVALSTVKLLRAELFGIGPYDVTNVVATVFGIAMTAVLAGALPIYRALRISPHEALRIDGT